MATKSLEIHSFWKSIKLYVKKPHVINKRLAGSVEIGIFEYLHKLHAQKYNDLVQRLQNTEELSINGIIKIFAETDVKAKQVSDDVWDSIQNFHANSEKHGLIVVYKLLAKNLKSFSSCYELAVLGKIMRYGIIQFVSGIFFSRFQ